jgi:hypothetical protein
MNQPLTISEWSVRHTKRRINVVAPVIVIIIIIIIMNYRKQPYWELHTYVGKYCCKGTKSLTREIALHVP